jgi:hypothetical protein
MSHQMGFMPEAGAAVAAASCAKQEKDNTVAAIAIIPFLWRLFFIVEIIT